MYPSPRLSILSQNLSYSISSASGAPPGSSIHAPLRPPSVTGPSNNAPGQMPIGQPRVQYPIQPTPGGSVPSAPARPPSSSPMPQPGANSHEAQEATFRNLLRMGGLPSSWSIQGKQIDPWLLHRTVSAFGGLQQVCAGTIGPCLNFSS